MDKVEYILDKFSFLREIQDEVKDKHIPIVLPEADIYDARGKLDKRMITAIDYLTSLGVVSPIFTGKGSLIKRNIKEANLENLLHPEIIDSSDSNTLTKYANIFRNRLEENNELFGSKKEIPSLDDTKDLLLQDKNMFGTSVLLDGKSDALLSGSCNETSKVLGALFKLFKSKYTSAFLTLRGEFKDVYGDDKFVPPRILADCAVQPRYFPESLEELYSIVDENSLKKVVDKASLKLASATEAVIKFSSMFSPLKNPLVGMLTYNTRSYHAGSKSSKDPFVQVINQATDLLRNQNPHLMIDGPIQGDAAVDPSVYLGKCIGSPTPIGGNANILIGSNLGLMNTIYKTTEQLGCLCMGPFVFTSEKENRYALPVVNDLSRNARPETIAFTGLITAYQALLKKQEAK